MGDRALATNRGRAPAPVVSVLGRNWAFFFLLLTLVVFSFTGKNFFALNNFQNIVHLATTSLLLACAETFVIITGGIDLSVGLRPGAFRGFGFQHDAGPLRGALVRDCRHPHRASASGCCPAWPAGSPRASLFRATAFLPSSRPSALRALPSASPTTSAAGSRCGTSRRA